MLRALAHAWSAEARRKQIRVWAESNLAWSVKIPKLIEFLHAAATRGATMSDIAA